MKPLKFLFLVVIFAALTCINSLGQVIQRETLVTIYAPGVDYGSPVGKVTGTYKYYFTIKLSKEGFMESLHWHAGDWNLVNDSGDPVKIIDSGHDTYGPTWDFFNNKDLYNTGYNITFDIPDGWLNEWWPALMPLEGSNVDMSLKLLCKGIKLDWRYMVQLHINANGEITANVVKP
jgi:hypothetical protein